MTRRGGWRVDDLERGSASVLFTFIVLVAVTLATFLVDAGTKLQAATRADTDAAEAARAAVQALGPVPEESPQTTAAAVTAARAYLARTGAEGTVAVTGPASITVTVTVTGSTPLLGLPVSETRTRAATLLIGTSTGEPVP